MRGIRTARYAAHVFDTGLGDELKNGAHGDQFKLLSGLEIHGFSHRFGYGKLEFAG